MPKHVPAAQDPNEAKFEVLPDRKEWDVAAGYALLSGGTMPPVIRGEDVETL